MKNTTHSDPINGSENNISSMSLKSLALLKSAPTKGQLNSQKRNLYLKLALFSLTVAALVYIVLYVADKLTDPISDKKWEKSSRWHKAVFAGMAGVGSGFLGYFVNKKCHCFNTQFINDQKNLLDMYREDDSHSSSESNIVNEHTSLLQNVQP